MKIGFLHNSHWVFVFILISTACTPKKDKTLLVATAANMQFVMQELCNSFSENTGITCELIHSSSGKLTAQILAGAPYDIFASADLKYPTELYQKGKTDQAPLIYAKGKLVLWTVVESIKPNLHTLSKSETKRIAMANPKTAPYGRAAKEVLEKKKIPLEEKLVYGESISQVNQFVLSKAVEVGFTAKSVVLFKQQGEWTEVPLTLYNPIKQGVVSIKNGKNSTQNARLFLAFLFSEEGKKILQKYDCL